MNMSSESRPDAQSAVPGAAPVRIEMLGRFAVLRGEIEVPSRAFGGRLAARLLRMLALRRGMLISKDVIIEALWPVRAPADAPGNVEVLIARIRRALGDRSLIRTGPGGYSLVGDARCLVDVEEFLTAAVAAHAAAGRDPDRALAAFRTALALWRGEPLVEDAYEEWAQEHRRHLRRIHLESLEGAASAALAAGDATWALQCAQAACELEPLREASALLTVRALAAGDDRAGALLRFDTFGRRLADELGVEPSAEARQLRQQVLCDQIRPTTDVFSVAASHGPAPSAVPGDAGHLAALPPERREPLALLALLGRRSTAGLLADAAGTGQREVLDALDALRRSDLVVCENKTWMIAPGALARRVTRGLDPGERARLHLLLAQALRAHRAPPAELAAHLAAGGDRPAAALAFAQAAEEDLDRCADRAALRLVRRGLAVCEAGEARARLLQIRGEAHRRCGDLETARADLQEAAAQAARGPQRSRILARLGIFEARTRDAVCGDKLIDLAIAEAGRDPAARGQSLAAGAIVDLALERPGRSRRRFEQARRLLEQASDPDGAARLLYWRGMARLIDGRLPEAIDDLDDLAGLPVTPEELLRWWDPQAARGHALVFAARPQAGLEEIDRALSRARRVGHPALRCTGLWHRSEALCAVGRAAQAAEVAQNAVQIAARLGHAECGAAAWRGLGIARQAAGDLAGAACAFDQSRRAAGGNTLFAGWASARLALVRVGQGRLAEADALTTGALRHGAALALHEARWARAELECARGDAAAPHTARAALAAARESGYLALVPRLTELAAA